MRRRPPRYAVFDPGLPDNGPITAALGADAVRLEPGRPIRVGGCRRYHVDFAWLTPARQLAVCRLLAAANGVSPAWAFVSAVQLHAVTVCDHCCHVCRDPAEGRAYYEKGRDAR